MADPNVVNIKGLPRIEEIVEGNLLIVENEQGTNTLDFVNFVIGPNNTSFYNEITDLQTNLVSVSSSTTSMIFALSASLTTQINAISAAVNSAVSNYFYNAGKITFGIGTTISSLQSILKPATFDINANDISLTLGSSAFPDPLSGYPVPYMLDTDIVNVGTGTNFYVRLTHAPIISALDIRYRIFKPYSV